MYKRHCSSKQLSHSMRCSNATATAVTVVMMLLLVVPWVSGTLVPQKQQVVVGGHECVSQQSLTHYACLLLSSAQQKAHDYCMAYCNDVHLSSQVISSKHDICQI